MLVYAACQILKAILATNFMNSIVESEASPSKKGLDGLAPSTADVSNKGIDLLIRPPGVQYYHLGGTAAMGKVTDTEGRLLGVKRLRVADASIVPIPSSGHPSAIFYTMAEQLVNIIINDACRGGLIWEGTRGLILTLVHISLIA